uniref:Uncharacterized protein n=1 Tax=Siphoviridae sp. ctNnX9 TaxID=2827859 RepID=A0A8S5TF71_9CAUD|nr:MAG TPA: hypothetical protein [Siphoviridae sp. ctNnX9]DAU00141.1 MAG TPA: hypothetical protein [Caudoviricetes sp.]
MRIHISGIVPPWNCCNGIPNLPSISSFSSGKGNTAIFIAYNAKKNYRYD